MPLGVGIFGQVVVEDGLARFEASQFEVGVDRCGENILEAVVFRAVVIAIHRAVLGVHAAGPHHNLLGDGVLGHIYPRLVGQRSRSEIGQLPVPIIGEHQQRAIELLLLGIFLERRIGWIGIPEHDLGHLAVIDARGAMPRLHDELVMRLHVAEHQHVDVRLVADGKNLVDGGHPAAQQSFPSLARVGAVTAGCAGLQFGEILVGVVRASVAAGIHGSGVEALLCADKRIPLSWCRLRRLRCRRAWLGGTGLPISGAASRT